MLLNRLSQALYKIRSTQKRIYMNNYTTNRTVQITFWYRHFFNLFLAQGDFFLRMCVNMILFSLCNMLYSAL